MREDTKVYDITIIGAALSACLPHFTAECGKRASKLLKACRSSAVSCPLCIPKIHIRCSRVPKIRAQELVDNLKEQMAKFDQTVCLEQAVESVEKQADGIFKLVTNKEIHYSKTVIITAGNGAFQPRKLELESAAQFENANLHYFIDDLNQFAGKRVAVLGGGDSAVDWALMLEPIAKEVSIIHRRDKFRAHEHSVENLRNSKVNVLTPFVPTELIGSERIEQIVIEEVKGERRNHRCRRCDRQLRFCFISRTNQNWGLKSRKIRSSSSPQWKRTSRDSMQPAISAHMKGKSS